MDSRTMTDDPNAQGGHAEAMDRMYRVTRHVYDATRKYYLLGRDRLIRQIDLPGSGRILEMGCGTGRNLIAAAEACPNAEIYGIDISEEMLKTARAQIAAAGLSDRITDRKSTRLNSSHIPLSRMPSSA